jgi:CRISPR system Cascade subunit CasB
MNGTNGAALAGSFVKGKIKHLKESANQSAVRADLARLRRGIGKPPGSVPDLWGITLDGLPDGILSKDGRPTTGEWAAHTALTLFALHQQGSDIRADCMHEEGATLGAALRRLIKSDDDVAAVKHRFDAAATSDGFVELSNHMRGLVQLLKANGVALDYAKLAEDMFWYQVPERKDSVRLRWGQDFYRARKTDADGKGNDIEKQKEVD